MSTFHSTWQSTLPEDEIGRQQAMKELLKPGVIATLSFDDIKMGEFVYSGLWDTMHAFYPTEENPLSKTSIRETLPESRRRYVRRDLRGREFIQLPYTLLADIILEVRG